MFETKLIFPFSAGQTAFESLRKAPFKLYLTGSRYFGVSHPDSDFDFFTKYNQTTEQYLKQSGFKIETERYMEVKKPERDLQKIVKIMTTHNIHVQLVEEPDKKMIIQETLAELKMTKPTYRGGITAGINKAANKKMWVMAYMLMEKMKTVGKTAKVQSPIRQISFPNSSQER